MKRKKSIIKWLFMFLCFFLIITGNLEAEPYWEVASTEARNDTLVLVKFELSAIPSCGWSTCPYDDYYEIWVSPCPPDKDCSGNEYKGIFYRSGNLTLLSTETYTISGTYYYYGSYGMGHDGSSCVDGCFNSGGMDLRIFPDDYVDISNSSWGKIKSLYK